MKLRKSLSLVVIAGFLTLSLLAGISCGSQPQAQAPAKVGIVQIAEHPSLDAARKGFVDALAANGYKDDKVNIIFKNAQGDIPTAQNIAQQFVADKVDLILAIATPAAQAAARATKEIPILITAVTDPVAAGLVQSMDNPGTNVTGTTDMNPVKEQLALVKKFKPDAKRVGIAYNAGETNSQVQVAAAEKAKGELGLEIVTVTVSTSAEVKQAVQSLVGRVDAIYVPTDNTVVTALESVLQVGEAHRLPVIVGEGDSVERGGLATYGLDYYKLGYQTGEMAVRVLKGEKPSAMAIETQKDIKLIINAKAAEKQGVKIPDDLKQKADKIIQ